MALMYRTVWQIYVWQIYGLYRGMVLLRDTVGALLRRYFWRSGYSHSAAGQCVNSCFFSLKSMEDITLYKYKATYIFWHDHVIRIGMKCRLCLKYQHGPNHRRLEKWGMINRCEVMCLLCALSPLSQMTNFPPQHHSSFQDTAKLTIIILDHPQKIYTWGHSRPITIIPILLGINPKSSATHRLIDLLYTYKKI